MIAASPSGATPRWSFRAPSPVSHLRPRTIPRATLLAVALISLISGGAVEPAAAQSSTATIEIRIEAERDAPSGADAPLPVQLLSVRDPSRAWTASMRNGEALRFRLVPPGRYRLISGTAERQVEVASGDELTVHLSRATAAAAGVQDIRVAVTDRTAYGTRFTGAELELLPESGGVYGLIERSDPLVITERIEGGGTYLEPQRLGASGASWTQTSFRLGDADITDPDRTGFAMLYPNLDALQAVSVATAGVHPDSYGTGTSVVLTPRMPAATWQRTVEFDASPPAFQSVNPLPNAVSIARLDGTTGGSFMVSGPVSDRLGVHLTGTFARSARFERERTTAFASRTQSLSGHLVYKATPRDDVRVFVQTDRLAFPGIGRSMLVDPGLQQQERSTLLSGTWNRTQHAGLAWSANATFAHASTTPALAGSAVLGTMERLRDGPVYELAASSRSRRHRTFLDWRGDPGAVRWLGLRHLPEFGVSASWTGVERSAPGASLIGELVDGAPARAWQYSSDGAPSRWGGSELSLWATNEIRINRRIDIDLGLRASAAGASRDAAAAHIPWRALSPSILGTWRPILNGWLTFIAGYAEYSGRLPLNYLAYGDPHSLTGSVHRWSDANRDQRLQPGEVGVTVARVGPCCANGQPNAIDPELRPTRMKEVRAVLQTRLSPYLILRLGGTDRREYRLVQPVNAAADFRNYSLTHVEDKALDQLVDEDDQLLPIFNRLPASFGTDSYILQNVDHNSARDHGLDLVLERPFRGGWGTMIGATAHKSEGIGGNRGFRPDENDQGVLGEVFSDPNSERFARGRLFFERGYIVKWSAVYQLKYGLRGGTVARYADGQHFSRVVIAPEVQQGLDFVPALPRGLTRFTYAFTLDTRMEKQLLVGGRRASLILDIFNLLNTNNEVEEDEVTGPAFRQPTAVQPPRSVRLGLRVTF